MVEGKYQALCRKLADLTPGGSEFHNDPDNCLRFIRESWDADRKLIKMLLRRVNSSRRLRRLWYRAAKREARTAEKQHIASLRSAFREEEVRRARIS